MMFTPIIAGGAASTLGAATSDSPLSVPDVTLTVARGASAPEPTGAPSISSVTDNGDGTLTILGSNFGTKDQAAPTLHDLVDVAYENGVANEFVGGLSDGASVPGYVVNTSSPYYEISDNVVINKSAPERFAGSGSVYEGVGAEMKLQFPMAYGGQETPDGNTQMYLGFWLERKWDWRYYRIAQVGGAAGTFIEGESITVSNSTETGRFIGVQTELDPDLYHFEMSTRIVRDLTGKTLTGEASGATIDFPTESRNGNGAGFESAGTKYLRLRDDAGGNGLRGSMTPRDAYVFSSGIAYDKHYDTLEDEQPDSAGFHEAQVIIDPETNAGVSRWWFNGRYRGEQSFDASGRDLTKSLTASLIGNDAFESFQRSRIHEVYQDSTVQRVYLGNASTYSACTKLELQRPSAWADGGITANKNLGELSGGWIYVVGPNGDINETGVAL